MTTAPSPDLSADRRQRNPAGAGEKVGSRRPGLWAAMPQPPAVQFSADCMVCGELLSYSESSRDFPCTFCGKIEGTHIRCPRGHFICDLCHNRDAMKVIEEVIFSAESNDPFAIAECAMSFPGLPMLGCQHAFIAGGSLMAALRKEGSRGITEREIREVFDRTVFKHSSMGARRACIRGCTATPGGGQRPTATPAVEL